MLYIWDSQNNLYHLRLRIKDFSLFCLSPWKEANPGPTRGSKSKFSNKKNEETQSGLQGPLPQEGKSQYTKIQENIGTIEPLEFYYKLCDIENNLLNLFNEQNNSEYINGIVNLSSHPLKNTEISVLSKELGFCPTPGAPDIGNIIQDLDAFKRRTRLQLFFSGSNQDPTERYTQSGVPFEHKSFKLKSSFNPEGPFQLESMLYSIE